jgi:DNA-binding CsgD family transcriptional regulator
MTTMLGPRCLCDLPSEGSMPMNVRKKNLEIRPRSFVLCERATGIARFRFEANPDGSLPAENVASVLAIHCVLRDQKPEDFELMVLPGESLLECVAERVQQLLAVGLAIANAPKISPREQEVLTGVVQNFANKEIAIKLKVSERTVKFHVSSLLRKFGVNNRVELGREATFGRKSHANVADEPSDQMLSGSPVNIAGGRVVNGNRPHQKEPVQTNHRPRIHGLVSVPQDRFAN